ncbi:hypothetical protein [Mycobacterium aquaticum]|uniref:Uncharacterized protein n=1 Tax=Mycobacterium aquaticum TaxID=1927124 RepID=A0A1X0A4U2_9MYCO|nr:hypothetical protein [Mycobacterium aquaticum]ORA24875.1 hypothetical protein BST13_33400 [Mycobacterium aquaticum]
MTGRDRIWLHAERLRWRKSTESTREHHTYTHPAHGWRIEVWFTPAGAITRAILVGPVGTSIGINGRKADKANTVIDWLERPHEFIKPPASGAVNMVDDQQHATSDVPEEWQGLPDYLIDELDGNVVDLDAGGRDERP